MASVAAERITGEAQLYERHSDLVFRYCLRNLGSREDAEDAAQTTFFQALRALRRGVVPRFEQAWLLTIARNECKTRHRAGSRRRRRELAQDPQSLAELAEAPERDGRLVGVQQALGRLPETQRRALLLREWQGWSYGEIARELGATRPAVEALLFRARRGLARELGEDTKMRRHALDAASLSGALKSLLGGGAAVKIAVGVAAVATGGTVAASNNSGPMPLPTRSAPSLVDRPAAARDRVNPAVAPAERRVRATGRPVVARQTAAVVPQTRRPTRRVPTRPALPAAEQSALRADEGPPPAAGAPTTPAPTRSTEAPPIPPLPSVSQPPAPLPSAGLPTPPAPPALPPAPELPALPAVPPAPALRSLPPVPEVPSIPGVPVPSDLPVLP